jgi:hypothetical protein
VAPEPAGAKVLIEGHSHHGMVSGDAENFVAGILQGRNMLEHFKAQDAIERVVRKLKFCHVAGLGMSE